MMPDMDMEQARVHLALRLVQETGRLVGVW